MGSAGALALLQALDLLVLLALLVGFVEGQQRPVFLGTGIRLLVQEDLL